MRKAKVKNDGSREYRPSLLVRLLMWAGVAFFLLIAGLNVKSNTTWYILLCVVPLFGGLAWFVMIQATQMTLTVRDDGLEYRLGSGTIFSRWDNLQKFGYRSSSRTVTMGIDLRNSVKQEVTGGRFDRMLFGEERLDFLPLTGVVKVPSYYDKQTKRWRVNTEKLAKTPFGQELLYYAPHLFEPEKEKG